MKALSLFSGIGGLDISAHAAGIETVGFCEIEPFAVKVLERRFPGVENHGDITRFTNRTLRELGGSPFHRFKCPADYNGTIDVVHGGFPCQDLSVAGKQRGLSGERSGLWFEMLRVISELRPAYVLAENVRGAINLALDTVYAGLVGEGYEVRTLLLTAAAFGAPHKRERMFVIGIRKDVADRLCLGSEAGIPRQNARKEGESNLSDYSGEGGGALWPTPSVHGNYNKAGLSERSGNGLSTAVKLWPTPHRNCSNGAGAHGDGGLNIQTAVSLWRTPDANCMRGASSEERMKWKREKGMTISINDQVGKGSLNPDWVEILMGFPIGWTDIDCDEPEPWPGWPAMMGERLWPTHTAGNHYRQGQHAPSEGNGHGKTLGGQCHEILDQYPYEPPRTVTKCADRAKRLKCLGNAVVPQQALALFEAIAAMGNSLEGAGGKLDENGMEVEE